MPIYKLIKKYDSCPIEWEENMLFTCSQHNEKMYRPLDVLHSDVYVAHDFIINNPENWRLHENIYIQNGVDVFLVPKKYSKDFANVIENGLKFTSVPKEVREFLEQYSNKNVDNSFPGSIKM